MMVNNKRRGRKKGTPNKPRKYERHPSYNRANTHEQKLKRFKEYRERVNRGSKFFYNELKHYFFLALDLKGELSARQVSEITGLPMERVSSALCRYSGGNRERTRESYYYLRGKRVSLGRHKEKTYKTKYVLKRRKKGVNGFLYRLSKIGKRRLGLYNLITYLGFPPRYLSREYIERRHMRAMAKEMSSRRLGVKEEEEFINIQKSRGL